jgi:hypothetical protein
MDKSRYPSEHSRISLNQRYYRIGGITIGVGADSEIDDDTFHPKFRLFEVDGPGEDTISIQHHFSLPALEEQGLGRLVYQYPPWAIYRADHGWTYLGVTPSQGKRDLHRVAMFSPDHTQGDIFSPRVDRFRRGHLHSLTLFSSDQILLAQVLADRQGCYLHAAGAILNGQGLLFVGHSEAGKSTMMTMLKGRAEILCDDRIIVRRNQGTFRIYGTWSHGDVPDVSPASAPLRAILFLEQAAENRLVPLADRREIISRLLSCLIRPLVTVQWWEQMLAHVEALTRVPCYIQRSDKSGEIVRLLERFV